LVGIKPTFNALYSTLPLIELRSGVADTGDIEIALRVRAARHQRKGLPMADEKVWLITGAGRGLGFDIAKAALAAGHAVVATGRDPAKVTAAIGRHDDLLAIKLDVTRLEDAHAAVMAAVTKFDRIDVLVNNAGNFYAGFFEELSPDQIRNQIETLLFGPMNVTRAALPVRMTIEELHSVK
jgi:NAD(P)-dependent dehydrogenase (short-subunit alcohol dehydrogenase family)